MYIVRVTNQQPNLERPREGEVGPLGLKENVTDDTGLELGLEGLGGKGGCFTQGCYGKWSSPSTLLSLAPCVPPPNHPHALDTDTHTHTQVAGQRNGLSPRVIRILNHSTTDIWGQMILFCRGQSCAFQDVLAAALFSTL